jgi:hypothetical protein
MLLHCATSQEDSKLHTHRRENMKSHVPKIILNWGPRSHYNHSPAQWDAHRKLLSFRQSSCIELGITTVILCAEKCQNLTRGLISDFMQSVAQQRPEHCQCRFLAFQQCSLFVDMLWYQMRSVMAEIVIILAKKSALLVYYFLVSISHFKHTP